MLTITEENRKWWIFTAMAIALSAVFLDQTAIAVILPAVQKQFQTSNVMLQWILNSYLLVLAILVTFGGKLGDVFGHKRIFLLGSMFFGLSSIACALAPIDIILVTGRALQGIGGAFIIPVTGVMIAHAFSEEHRGKAMGLYVAVASIFLSLGPLLSGFLVQYFSWRWVFWINVPIVLVSVVLAIIAVPAGKNHSVRTKPLDWFGFLTFSVFMTAIVVALMEGVNWGWGSTTIIALFVISVIFFILFILVELRAVDPIVYLPLFCRKNFLGANLCLFLFTLSYSSSVFWAILLQNVMGYSSFVTGLFYLPATLPFIFMSPLGGKLRDRYGPRLPTLLGLILVAVGIFWIAATVFKGYYSALFPGILLFGIGPALVYSAVMTTAISSVPLTQMGMASGIANGLRQVGRVLGIALIGSAMSNVESYLIEKITLSNTGFIMSHQQAIQLLKSPLDNQTLLQAAGKIDIGLLSQKLKAIYTFAFSMSMVLTGVLVIVTVFLSFLLPNKPLKNPQS